MTALKEIIYYYSVVLTIFRSCGEMQSNEINNKMYKTANPCGTGSQVIIVIHRTPI